MDLTYTTKSGSSKKEIRVPFNPPLAGYDEVKGRLLQMKVDAEDALGMVRLSLLALHLLRLRMSGRQAKHPVIDDFIFPSDAWKTGILIAALAYTTFAPVPNSAVSNLVFLPAMLIRDALPTWVLTGCWMFLAVCHTSECFYTYSLCRRHQMPFVPAVSALSCSFGAIDSSGS